MTTAGHDHEGLRPEATAVQMAREIVLRAWSSTASDVSPSRACDLAYGVGAGMPRTPRPGQCPCPSANVSDGGWGDVAALIPLVRAEVAALTRYTRTHAASDRQVWEQAKTATETEAAYRSVNPHA